MKTNQTRIIIFSFIITLFISCDSDRAFVRAETKKLTGTVWVKDKVEIYTPDSMLVESIEPTTCEKNELLKFDEEDRLIKLNNCRSGTAEYECGQWMVSTGGLNITIGLNRIVPESCNLVNHFDIIAFNNADYTLSNDQLIISERGIDVHRAYLSADTIEKIEAGELLISTFYTQSSDELSLPDDADCCDPYVR
ncbi:MAG: hypothetical protein R3B93_15250 [Bacteroidia bacterium]